MTTLTNIEIVQAFTERETIESELSELSMKIQELYTAHNLLAMRNEAATKTTEVHNGVAITVCDSRVYAVDYQIGKWAHVFEHVRHPGTFIVQAHTRGRGDQVLPEPHASFQAAMLAAKDYVTK
jgi:hypothetical protein